MSESPVPSADRLEMEQTPEGRLATVVREQIYRYVNLGRKYPLDFADLREALEVPVRMEILSAKLEEARLNANNGARVFELLLEISQLGLKPHMDR